MSIFHLCHRSISRRIVVKVIKMLLVSQSLLILLGEAIVEERPGTPIPLTVDDIQQIINAHNFFRSRVNPQASNMQRIVSSQYFMHAWLRTITITYYFNLNCSLLL